MSIGSDETIADILAEMREFADTDSQSIGRDVLRRRIQHFARRIEQSVTDCNQFGDAAAMRKALDMLLGLFDGGLVEYSDSCDTSDTAQIQYVIDKAEAALSAPPRNCDVGTAEEQYARVRAFCKRHKVGLRCVDCPVNGVLPKNCALIWSQMPYEEA